MLISRNLHKKSCEVSIKARSTPASLSFKGQVTKHRTVKWSIQAALTGFDPMTLCDAGAMLYKLSFEATQLGAGQFVGLICSSEGTRLMNERNEYLKRWLQMKGRCDLRTYLDNSSSGVQKHEA